MDIPLLALLLALSLLLAMLLASQGVVQTFPLPPLPPCLATLSA